MNANRTPDAAREILARELFVQDRANPYGNLAGTRELWYDTIAFSEQDTYRNRAARLAEALGESEIELTWRT